MSKTGHGRLLATILGAAAVACLIYAGAGFFLVPRLIERQLTAMADQRLGQKLSIEKLKFNPFVLSVEATGVRLAQGNGPPILAARRVYLDLALLGSGFGRGWVLSEAQADGLQVQLELANGHLNLADLLHRWQQGNPPATPGIASRPARRPRPRFCRFASNWRTSPPCPIVKDTIASPRVWSTAER